MCGESNKISWCISEKSLKNGSFWKLATRLACLFIVLLSSCHLVSEYCGSHPHIDLVVLTLFARLYIIDEPKLDSYVHLHWQDHSNYFRKIKCRQDINNSRLNTVTFIDFFIWYSACIHGQPSPIHSSVCSVAHNTDTGNVLQYPAW